MAASRLTTIAALRHRNYRIFWIGVVVSVIGWQVQYLGVGWLVYRLTGSPLYLGLVGLFTAVPTIALTMFGGVLADRMNRLRLLKITQGAAGVSAFVLATLTATDTVQVWHVLLLAAVNGTVQAFDTPARQALLPHLVERADLMNAVALSSVAWQVSRVFGPAIAGLLIAAFGEAMCFYATAFGYAVMVAALGWIKVSAEVAPARQNVWRNMADGLGFVVRTPLFAVIIGLTFMDSIFGASYTTLMPVFARDILEAGAEGYGVLLTAAGVGAIVGTFGIATWGGRVARGRLLLFGPILFGSLLVAFAASRVFGVSMAIIGAMGLANSLYMVTAQTVLQAEVPDALRGRVMGIYGLTWSLTPLGGMVSGTLATVAGAPLAAGLGGLVVVCFAGYVAAAAPQIRRLA